MLTWDYEAVSQLKHREFQVIFYQTVCRFELSYIWWNLHDVLANKD